MGVLQKYGFNCTTISFRQGEPGVHLGSELSSADLVFHIPIYLIFNVAIANATQRIVMIQNLVTILLS